MFKKFLILIIISISLFAATSNLSRVYSYDRQMSQTSDDDMLRIFHSLQNIYIKSIIQNDEKLKIETLKRLVKCAKILKFDEGNYKKELSTLLKNRGYIKKKPLKRSRTSQKTTNKQILRLISVTSSSKNISFVFDKNIKSSDIKSFALKSKYYYKKIFDFRAILPSSVKIKTPKILTKLRVAQYDKTTFRVVLQTKKPRNYYLKIKANRVTVDFYKQKTKTKKISKVVYKTEYQQKYFAPDNKIIVLDPGHGGKDSGAIGYQRRYEKRAVLKIALKAAKELKKRGYKVYLTRSGDYFVTLRNRTRFANRRKADLFISIHANAAPKKSKYLISKGLETFFLSPNRSKRSERVAALENRSAIADMDYYTKNTFLSVMNRAKIIQANKMALDVQQGILKSLRKRYKVIDGGVREAPFWVLVGAQMPAILIETGYITNPTEGVRLFNFRYEDLIAKGIADGVDSYFLKN